MAMKLNQNMERFHNYSDSDSDEEEDHLQKAVELAEPIPSVRRQAYILIVGDPQTGKSMLAWSFTRFPRTPAKRYHSIAINPESRRSRKRTSIGLHFFCAPFISGDDGCFLKKPPKVPYYNLIVYLFDVNRRSTFRNLFYKWHSEVSTYLGDHSLPPTLLVGNKIDLRPSNLDLGKSSYETVWTDEGEMSATVVEAEQYIEVCALAEINTRDLLVKILRMLNVTWEPDF